MKKLGIILIMLFLACAYTFSQTVENEAAKSKEKSLSEIRNNSRDNIIVYKNNFRKGITLQRKMTIIRQNQMKTQMQRKMILRRRRLMMNQQQLRQRSIRQRMLQQQQRQGR